VTGVPETAQPTGPKIWLPLCATPGGALDALASGARVRLSVEARKLRCSRLGLEKMDILAGVRKTD